MVEVELADVAGDWFLQEYVNSHDGKPIGPNQPYLCPESRMSITTNISAKEQNLLLSSNVQIIIFSEKIVAKHYLVAKSFILTAGFGCSP